MHVPGGTRTGAWRAARHAHGNAMWPDVPSRFNLSESGVNHMRVPCEKKPRRAGLSFEGRSTTSYLMRLKKTMKRPYVTC